MPKNTDQQIVEVLTGTAEDPHAKRVQEALSGAEYLYGLPEPEASYDDAVRAWAAKESLRGAAERFARAGRTPASDAEVEAIVKETYGLSNPDWSDLERLERTATVINRLAAQSESY